jgi:hypothetical protein
MLPMNQFVLQEERNKLLLRGFYGLGFSELYPRYVANEPICSSGRKKQTTTVRVLGFRV